MFPREDGEAQTPVLSAHSQRSAGRRAVEGSKHRWFFKERGPRGLVEGGGAGDSWGEAASRDGAGKGDPGAGAPS